MARIAWVNIPDHKNLFIALTYIVWIWQKTSRDIIKNAKMDWSVRVKDLNEKQLDTIRAEVGKIPTEVEVRREQALNIKRLKEIWSYRWIRHRLGLPCRWQSTASNARTCKSKAGKKRVAIAGKKG